MIERLFNVVGDLYRLLKKSNMLHQCFEELYKVMVELEGKKFKKFVEIGTLYGGTFWVYANMLCSENAELVGIDIIRKSELDIIEKELLNRKYKVRLYKADAKDVVNTFKDEEIDLLHIDDQHIYEVTSRNFYKYYPKVKKGGIIIIHDTIACTGCGILVKELEEKGMKLKTFSGSLRLHHLEDPTPTGTTLVFK